MKFGFVFWLIITSVNFAINLLKENDIIALLWLIVTLLSMILIKQKEYCDVNVLEGEE